MDRARVAPAPESATVALASVSFDSASALVRAGHLLQRFDECAQLLRGDLGRRLEYGPGPCGLPDILRVQRLAIAHFAHRDHPFRPIVITWAGVIGVGAKVCVVRQHEAGRERLDDGCRLDAALNVPQDLYSYPLRRRAGGEPVDESFDRTVDEQMDAAMRAMGGTMGEPRRPVTCRARGRRRYRIKVACTPSGTQSRTGPLKR